MKYLYKVIKDDLSNTEVISQIDENGLESFIPKDEGNSDYQRYLRWLENPDADESGTLS